MEENESKVFAQVPAKISPWTSFKSFLFQDIVLELTPKQEKVFKEVHDFWNQEIYFDKGIHLRYQPDALMAQKQQPEEEPEIKISL